MNLASAFPFHWTIDSSILGCGTRTLQGWSAGLGIAQKFDLEVCLGSLLYFSNHPAQLPKDIITSWHKRYPALKPSDGFSATLNKNTDDAFSHSVIGNHRYLFMSQNYQYIFSSKRDYPQKLVDIVNKYDLGEISLAHAAKNKAWGSDKITAGSWNWNGNEIPLEALKKFGVESYV